MAVARDIAYQCCDQYRCEGQMPYEEAETRLQEYDELRGAVTAYRCREVELARKREIYCGVDIDLLHSRSEACDVPESQRLEAGRDRSRLCEHYCYDDAAASL